MGSASPYRTEGEAYQPQWPDYAARQRAAAGLKWVLLGLVCRVAMGLVFGGLVAVSTSTGHALYGEIVAWGYAAVDASLVLAMLLGTLAYVRLPPEGVAREGVVFSMVLLVVIAGLGFLTAASVHEQALLTAKKITHTMTSADRTLAEDLQTRAQVVGGLANIAGLIWAGTFAASLQRTAGWLENARLEVLAKRVLSWTIRLPLIAIVAGVAISVLGLLGVPWLAVGLAAMTGLAVIAIGITLFVFWVQLLAGMARSLAEASIPDPVAAPPIEEPQPEAWEF